MKKIIALIMCIVMSACVFAGCTSSSSSSRAQREEMERRENVQRAMDWIDAN